MNNLTKSDDLEEQLNVTRIKLYEQTKDMTTQERVAYFNDFSERYFAERLERGHTRELAAH